MTSLAELQQKVRAQRDDNPRMYGQVDFDLVPERFTTDLSVKSILPEPFASRFRPHVLRDEEKVQRALAYTMLGDTVADPYAALIPKYGFKKLVDMLVRACEHGLDAVPDAPPELERFVTSMERTPDWLDLPLAKEGARASRVSMAMLTPYVIRGAFMATFINKYSGLPMAMTGALSQDTSVQRVKETASFFTTAALPGSLARTGPGFRAAAMVRLMHSMVRANLLLRPKLWDVATYGIPIPQVDQMPAGTMPSFVTAFRAVSEGRGFTRRERAVVEFCRHQCFLLGLPEELLHETPQAIFEAMLRYSGTLRDGYDDATNGALVRATMKAHLPADKGPRGQVVNRLERSVSKVFFKHTFKIPDETASKMGVVPEPLDYAIFAGFQAYALPTLFGHMALERIPVLEGLADRYLVRRLDELLVDYGHAEYTTDPTRYAAPAARPAGPPAHAHGAPA